MFHFLSRSILVHGYEIFAWVGQLGQVQGSDGFWDILDCAVVQRSFMYNQVHLVIPESFSWIKASELVRWIATWLSHIVDKFTKSDQNWTLQSKARVKSCFLNQQSWLMPLLAEICTQKMVQLDTLRNAEIERLSKLLFVYKVGVHVSCTSM